MGADKKIFPLDQLAMVVNRNYHLKLSQVDQTWYIDGSTKGKWSSIIPEFQMGTSSCSIL